MYRDKKRKKTKEIFFLSPRQWELLLFLQEWG